MEKTIDFKATTLTDERIATLRRIAERPSSPEAGELAEAMLELTFNVGAFMNNLGNAMSQMKFSQK